MNHCHLCGQDKDAAMLLVHCAGQRCQVCGACAWAVAQALVRCRALERSYVRRNDPVPAALRQILEQPP
jgi:ribosome-binding protein aMBF1 (putative translation factor)